MVYTGAQTTLFFESPAQSGIPTCMRQYLEDNESLEFVHELIDYLENDTWKKITDKMRRPPMIADPSNPAGPMIHQAAFMMSAKSLTR